MASNLAKEARQMVSVLEGRGYKAAIEGGHWKIRDPRTNAPLVTIALTPSDQRFWKNTVAGLKKVTDSAGKPLLDRDPRASTTPKKEDRGVTMTASVYASDRQAAEKRAVQEVLRGGLARSEFARHVFEYANEHAEDHERRFTNAEGAHWHVRQLLVDKKVPEWALRWIGRAANDVLDVPVVEVPSKPETAQKEDAMPTTAASSRGTLPWTELHALRDAVERTTEAPGMSVLSFSRLVADKMGVPVHSARSHVRRLLNKENVNEDAVAAITSALDAATAPEAPVKAEKPKAKTEAPAKRETSTTGRMKVLDLETQNGLRKVVEDITADMAPPRNGREWPYGTWPAVGRAAQEAADRAGVEVRITSRGGGDLSKSPAALLGDRMKAALLGQPVTRTTRDVARALVQDWPRQKQKSDRDRWGETEVEPGPLAKDVQAVIEKAREAQPESSMPTPSVTTTFPEEWLDSTATDELPLHLRALALMLRPPETFSPNAAMQLAMEIMRLEVAARQH